MKNLFLVLTVFTLIISCSSDDSSDAVPTNNNVVQETFGNWSPDFTNQTANFTQARTGTQGTQQTRTIVVTVTSSTASSTEEILEEDINQDEDLFDDVEVTTTNYSASESLGSFQTISNSIIKDNDMVLKIGNQSYPLIVGTITNYGAREMDRNNNYYDLDCQGKGLFNFDIELFTEGIELDNDAYPNGEGRGVYFELWSENKSNLQASDYSDILNKVNQYYDLNFSSLEDFEEWYDNNYPDGDSKFDTDDCFVYDLLNLTSTYSSIDRYESDNIFYGELNFPDGILKYNLNSDGSHTIEFTGGTDTNGLPVSFYFNGFLSSFDYSDDTSKSIAAKRKNKKLFNN